MYWEREGEGKKGEKECWLMFVGGVEDEVGSDGGGGEEEGGEVRSGRCDGRKEHNLLVLRIPLWHSINSSRILYEHRDDGNEAWRGWK